MATEATGEKVILNFIWQGPECLKNGLTITVVRLVFKNARTEVSVKIPDDLCEFTFRKLPFTCRRYDKETYPESLNLTIEQIQNLTLKAGFFDATSLKSPAFSEIKFVVSEGLEIGKTYNLMVISNGHSLSTSLIEEEIADS